MLHTLAFSCSRQRAQAKVSAGDRGTGWSHRGAVCRAHGRVDMSRHSITIPTPIYGQIYKGVNPNRKSGVESRKVIGTSLTSSSPGLILSTKSSTQAATTARTVTLVTPWCISGRQFNQTDFPHQTERPSTYQR